MTGSSRFTAAAVTTTAIALVGGGLYLVAAGGGADEAATTAAPATRPPVSEAPADAVDPGIDPGAAPDVTVDPGISGPASGPVTTAAEGPAVDTVLPVSDAEDGLFPVANVLGVSRSVAEARLSVFDVQVEVVTASNVNDFDEVTEQTPGGGERLAAGGTVELVFSERPRPETVNADPFPTEAVDSVEFDGLERGDCAVFSVEERVLVFEPIDCDEAHDAQLIARFDLVDGPEEFDEAVIDRLIRAHCDPIFLEFVGVSRLDSEAFRQFTVRPNAERYASEGERESLCVILPANGVRTLGSAEGTLW